MAIRRKKSTPASPINAKQQSLQLEQEQLHQRMRKLEALLAEAPKKAQELERRQREEGIARATGRSRRLDAPSGVNVRYNTSAGAASAPRKLRKERQQAKIQFIVLFLLLLALVWFVISQLAK
jgi:hypothetical protein